MKYKSWVAPLRFKSHLRRLGNVQLIHYPKGLQQNKSREWESNLCATEQAVDHKSNSLVTLLPFFSRGCLVKVPLTSAWQLSNSNAFYKISSWYLNCTKLKLGPTTTHINMLTVNTSLYNNITPYKYQRDIILTITSDARFQSFTIST